MIPSTKTFKIGSGPSFVWRTWSKKNILGIYNLKNPENTNMVIHFDGAAKLLGWVESSPCKNSQHFIMSMHLEIATSQILWKYPESCFSCNHFIWWSRMIKGHQHPQSREPRQICSPKYVQYIIHGNAWWKWQLSHSPVTDLIELEGSFYTRLQLRFLWNSRMVSHFRKDVPSLNLPCPLVFTGSCAAAWILQMLASPSWPSWSLPCGLKW